MILDIQKVDRLHHSAILVSKASIIQFAQIFSIRSFLLTDFVV